MNKPDILFFLCLSDRGGAEISMLRVAQGLATSGRNVTIAAYGRMPFLARELGFGGEVIDLECKRTVAAFFVLLRLLQRRSFTTLISALTHTNIAAIFAARFSSQPVHVIVTEHGNDGLMACGSSQVFAILTKFAYARAAGIVAVSKALAQKWREILPARVSIRTIYNPVVDDTMPDNVRPAHPWLADKIIPVIIGIGRLKPEKNFALLIRAFAQAASARDLRLVILGEGEERLMLEALAQELGISDKILLPGFVGDIHSWLAPAALLVCPSTREGFGNVIVEALACGVPVIATDCPYGPAEILQNGRIGRLVPVNDVAALARAIGATLDEKTDRDMLRLRAADFTVQRCIDDYAALVDNSLC